MEMSRRNFFHTVGLLAFAVGLSGSLDSVKAYIKKPKGNLDPRQGQNVFTVNGKSLVVVVGGKNVKSMVKESLARMGGLEKIGVQGKTVLVKPNVVGGKKHPTTTNPELVGAVATLLYEAGASKVYVGDMSALIRLSTKRNMEKTGIKSAAEKAGAELLYLEDYEWVRVNLPKGKYIKEVDVSEWIFKVDRIINLPVIKTHRYAGYSICLKNFVGATHLKNRPYFVDRAHWEEVVSEINLAYGPDLNIVDGTKIMMEGGPWSGKVKEANLLVCSGDRVAADVVGLAIIKAFAQGTSFESVWERKQVRRAVEIGLGARRRDEIELITASLDKRKEFKALIEKVMENVA